jgi:hypothetical protein
MLEDLRLGESDSEFFVLFLGEGDQLVCDSLCFFCLCMGGGDGLVLEERCDEVPEQGGSVLGGSAGG